MKNPNYKLSVPVMNINFYEHMNREKTAGLMKQMQVDRVFIAVEGSALWGENREEEINAMKANAEFLHDCGFEVGAWFWTFQNVGRTDLTRLTSPDGKVSKDTVCPTDKVFQKTMFDFLQDCAKTGIDMMMFDDDYRYGFHDMGFGCLCENHYKRICELLGENVPVETVADGILNGGKNKYRDAFIKANGLIFEEFAEACRRAVDSVNPDIRLGFCSCITSWDIDGTTPDRIAKLLAGSTKPFYRLIGAPYWAALNAWGHSRLSYVIEQERLEAMRRQDSSIEIFSEGDTFPRPRFRVPAAYLEGFDTVLRADGCTDGILKYSFDYTSDFDYETGYNEAHLRHLLTYDAIDDFFCDKTAVGIRVFDKMTKFADVDIPADRGDLYEAQLLAFNCAARFLASNSIPICYDNSEYAGIAFGEDAKILSSDDICRGLILDYAAAKVLSDKGIDTGIRNENGIFTMSGPEYFSTGEKVGHLSGIRLHKIEVNKNAEVLSWCKKDGEKAPVCYFYTNALNQKFVVYAFDGYSVDEEAFRNYQRQEQIIKANILLSGRQLPAVCPKNPDLYILAKTNGNKMSVGLWNFFPDKIYSPRVELEHEIKSCRFWGVYGTVDGNIINLSEIEPYGFAAIEVDF